MGIRHEINTALKGLCKKANSVWGYYAPAHGGYSQGMAEFGSRIKGKEGFAAATAASGIYKGIKRIMPGLIDGLVGIPAGFINGVGTGIGYKLSGDPFHVGYLNGYGESTDFVKKYMSDPTRYAQQSYGGKYLDGRMDALKRHFAEKENISNRTKEIANKYEGLISGTTEFAGSFPAYGGLFAKALGKASKLPALYRWLRASALSAPYDAGLALNLYGNSKKETAFDEASELYRDKDYLKKTEEGRDLYSKLMQRYNKWYGFRFEDSVK